MLLIFLPPPGTNRCRALMSDSVIEDMLDILDGASPQIVLQHESELCDATRIVLQSSIFLRPCTLHKTSSSLRIIASVWQCRQRSISTTML